MEDNGDQCFKTNAVEIDYHKALWSQTAILRRGRQTCRVGSTQLRKSQKEGRAARRNKQHMKQVFKLFNGMSVNYS